MRHIYKLLFVAVAIIGALVVIELALRTNPSLAPNTPLTPAYNAPCFRPGDYYWFALKPNTSCTVQSMYDAFPPFTIEANELGIRNPPVQKDRPSEVKRILFLGDSFAMGWGVSGDEAYPAQTQRIWNTTHTDPSIESVNAGLVHTAQGYQYLFLKHELTRIRPDVIVLGFYPFNDIYDNQFSSIWTTVDAQGLPEHIGARNSYVDSDGRLKLSYNATLGKLPIIGSSRLLLLTTTAWDNIFSKHKKTQPDSYLRICIYKVQCHELDEGKDKVKRLFVAIRDLANAHNIPLLVVRKPAEFITVRGVRLAKYGIPYTLTPEDKNFSHKEFADFFAAQQIPYLDLRDAFLTQDNNTFYFDNDDHWNPKGHAIAAGAIAKKLEELITP